MPENTREPGLDESLSLDFFDRAARLGGWLRIGTRPSAGDAEVTFVLFQPDGSVLFDHRRAEIADEQRFRAGGACFEIRDGPTRLRVTYDGAALHLHPPLDLEQAGRPSREPPQRSVQLALDCVGLSPVWGGGMAAGRAEAVSAEGRGTQQVRADGSLVIDGQHQRLDAFGLHDHSRAARQAAALRLHRRLTCAFDAGFGFVALRTVTRDGRELQGGFLFRDGRVRPVERILMHTDWTSEGRYPSRIGLILGSTADELRITGKVFNIVPLSDRREGEAMRLTAGMTLWRCGPHVGYGLSEYCDQAA